MMTTAAPHIWSRPGSWVMAIVVVAIGWTFSAGSSASASTGKLQVAAAVPELSSDTPSTSVVVTNAGETTVAAVTVEVDAPKWAHVTIALPKKAPSDQEIRLGTLKPGESALLTLNSVIPTGGRAGKITLVASSKKNPKLLDVTTVALPPVSSPVSVEIVGASQVGDHSPGLMTVLVRNNTAGVVEMRLEVTGDGLEFATGSAASASTPRPERDQGWTSGSISIDPNQVHATEVTVSARTPVRPRSTVAMVAVLDSTAENPLTYAIATHEVSLTVAADGLVPAATGIGSVLVLPGLFALLAFLLLREKDRAKLGIPARNLVEVVWDNKLWLLAALAVSLISVTLVQRVAEVDLIATPWSWALLIATIVTTLIGLVISRTLVWLHRRRTPLINNDSDFRAVIGAIGGSGGERLRQVYQSGGKNGLIVHRDYNYLVLTPQVDFSVPGTLSKPGKSLADFIKAGAALDGEYRMAEGWISRPTVVPANSAWTGAWQDLFCYVDKLKGED